MCIDFSSDIWKCSFEALLHEAECCAAQWRNRQSRLSDDHVVQVFTHLMLLKGSVKLFVLLLIGHKVEC